MRNSKLLFGALIIGVFLLACTFPALAEDAVKQKNSTVTNMGLFGAYTWDIAVDPNDNNYVYLATYYSPNGFFYSHDNGDTWHGLPANSDHGAGRAVEVNPTNGNVYALLGDLLVSTDHGSTYTVAAEFGSGGTDLLYDQSALFVGVNDTVQKTTDEGASFSSSTVCSGETVWSLANYSTTLYALCHNYTSDTDALYASADAGATWTDLDIATDGITDAEAVVVNGATGHVFLIPSSLGGSTYRSTDAGATWTTLSGAPNAGHMTFNSTGRAYVGWYFSDDEGTNWTAFGTGGDYNHLIYPDPTNLNILYDTSVPGFLKSTDSGSTWTASVDNIRAIDVTSIAQATDKDNVWVGTQNGPAMTANFTDDSPTWTYMPVDNYMNSGYDAVWIKPGDSNIVVASSSMDLDYTADGGTTWNTATVDITLTGAVFQFVSQAGAIYGVVGPNTSAGTPTGGVIKSEDDGATWTSLDFPSNGAARSLDIAPNGDLFVGGHSTKKGIYKYNGSSWTKLDAPNHEYVSILIDPDDANNIYALSAANGFFKSEDRGATWAKSNAGLDGVSSFNEFNSLAVQDSTTPNTLYLSGVKGQTTKGVIYKSDDNGDNWEKYYIGKKGETLNALLFDGLVAGNSRGLFSMKSRAAVKVTQSKKKVTAGSAVSFTLMLRDKTTNKKLKNQKVSFYKKVGNKKKFRLFKTIRTNNKGKKTFTLYPEKKIRLYGKWVPRKAKRAEYANAQSKIKTVRME